MLTVGRLALRDALDAAANELMRSGIETARNDAEWLLAARLGVARFDLYLNPGRELSEVVVEAYRAAVGRRARREPLQRILGWEEFRGLRFSIAEAVLVPRPETETLADLALALLPPASAGRRPLVIDMGTGSGCLACAIAVERADVDIVAVDVSPPAAAIARRNASRLGLARRVRVVAAELFEALGGLSADLIVSNPPYLPSETLETLLPEVRDHEPRVALDGGADGLRVIRPLVAGAPGRLRPSGAIALETGGGAQSETVARLLETAGFTDVTVRGDLCGVDRFVSARVRCPA